MTRTKAEQALSEASISVACLLEDISAIESSELNLSKLQKDIEHLQDQITILENQKQSDVRELIVGKEPSGFWAIRENGRLAITSRSYNEICKAINTYARAYEEHGIPHTISIQESALGYYGGNNA